MKFRKRHLLAMIPAWVALSACDPATTVSVTPEGSTAGTSLTPPASSSASASDPAPGPAARVWSTDALLFTGSGTWSTEVSNLRTILGANGASFREATSAQLNAMSLDELSGFGVLIFPGGAGGTEASSLTSQTHANLRAAVQLRGVGYIGFCAGAFIGEAPAPAAGGDVSYGLGIVDGPILDYYYLENQGTDIAMTLASFPDGSTRDLLWYGGPVTPGGAGVVIAKYPDGSPMISQLRSGKGLAVLVGTHPTANPATLSALGVSSSDGIHQDFAWSLIHAAMQGKTLPAF